MAPARDVALRQLRPEDWRLWRDLRLRALADAPDAFAETLAEARARDDAGWQALAAPRPHVVQLVAERGGAPAGMAVAVIDLDDPARANLYAMWVAPEARGAGLGRALVDAALRWTRGRAALELSLQVTEGNEPARALYEGCGFRDTGRREALRGGGGLHGRVLGVRQPPLVMGVVNVTPDSFSDGGRYLDPAAAIDHGLALAAEGADLLDVGGEATNPRAAPIDAAEELRRVLPVIEGLIGGLSGGLSGGGGLAAAGPAVSVDTTKAAVARAAVAAGAAIVNDVSGGLFDPAMPEALAGTGATYIAGHLRGRTIAEVFAAEAPVAWDDVARELAQRLAALPEDVRARAWVDPGLGFGKGADPEANLELLRRAGELGRAVRRPVVVGPSRKRFLRRLVGADPSLAALDAATVAACLGAVRGGAQVLRVHNVALLRAALAVYTRI
ncbi:MAG TPA: dihydropteroate synthase [Kofleriaceae bacterium]|nr:dihydropteroate synthase [Kofleriaceae bacterium]